MVDRKFGQRGVEPGLIEKRGLMLARRFNEWRSLRQGAQVYICSCPMSGHGVNHWIFGAACVLRKQSVSEAKMEEIIRAAMQGCGREDRPGEIERAVVRSLEYVKGQPHRVHRKWPEINLDIVKKVTTSVPFNKQELITNSPVRPSEISTDGVIDTLFPGNPLICCGFYFYQAQTSPREMFRGRHEKLQFIVPSPMRAKFGETQEGKRSQRCEKNVGARRFLVTESDLNNEDEQASILWYLTCFLPLVMVVHSGGKSLHAWYFIKGIPEEKLRAFMEHAVTLGADDATFSPFQWVRMPNGRRSNGKKQSLIYFDPQPLQNNG